jgi:hypothetical protein
MSDAMYSVSAPTLTPDANPALQNPAIAHCCEVWESTFRQALNEGKSLVLARVAAHKAYQKSLPPLSGNRNIRNFIACVAHGMLQGSILSPAGARLIFAAQVAKSVARTRAKKSKAGAE